MSFGVKTLVASGGVPFAIQSGGHMRFIGANNIDGNGILFSTAALNGLAISEDEATVSVGPGNHWTDVFVYLEVRYYSKCRICFRRLCTWLLT